MTRRALLLALILLAGAACAQPQRVEPYAAMARRRIADDAPLITEVASA
jgi:hypothetical protein